MATFFHQKKIFNFLRSRIQYLLGFGYNGRKLKAFDDDLYIVAYPKSGNTWLNFLIGYIRNKKINEGDLDFDNLEEVVADIYFNSALHLKKMRRPRILKSHEAFLGKYKKVIYIVRDPRSVAISYFKFLIAIGSLPKNYSLDKFITNFLKKNTYDKYGDWNSHVLGWYNASLIYKDRILIVKYEDLKSNTLNCLTKILDFSGISYTKKELLSAISYCSISNMRNLEQKKNFRYKTNFSFIRKAQINSWKKEIGAEHSNLIRKKWLYVMNLFGYK